MGVKNRFDASFRRAVRNFCVNLITMLIFRKDPSQSTLSLSKGLGMTHWILLPVTSITSLYCNDCLILADVLGCEQILASCGIRPAVAAPALLSNNIESWATSATVLLLSWLKTCNLV